jgi:plastocyanin
MKNDPRALFVPDTVTIASGDTVNWTNSGLVTHTVTFDPGQAVNKEDVALPAGAAPFGSGDMEEDATFSHTFTVKGTYKYVCKYHETMGMVGTVIVS